MITLLAHIVIGAPSIQMSAFIHILECFQDALNISKVLFGEIHAKFIFFVVKLVQIYKFLGLNCFKEWNNLTLTAKLIFIYLLLLLDLLLILTLIGIEGRYQLINLFKILIIAYLTT